MKAIILAAGKGTRMRPLTDTIPKPLVEVLNKPILTWVMDAIPASVDEIIIVVGYMAEKIKEYYGAEYKGRKITYVTQTEQRGTEHALRCCKDLLSEKFLVIHADDIHDLEAIQKAVDCDSAIVCGISDHPQDFGVIEHTNHILTGLEEKPSQPKTNLVNTGCLVLHTDIFDLSTEPQPNGEYYLTDLILTYAATHKVQVIPQDMWIPIGRPADIQIAEAELKSMGIGGTK